MNESVRGQTIPRSRIPVHRRGNPKRSISGRVVHDQRVIANTNAAVTDDPYRADNREMMIGRAR